MKDWDERPSQYPEDGTHNHGDYVDTAGRSAGQLCSDLPIGDRDQGFLKGEMPDPRRRKGQVEMYDSGQFLTLTGRRIWGEGVEERQAQLETLYRGLFPPEQEDSAPEERTIQGFAGEDEGLLRMMRYTRDGAKFADVFDGGSLAYHADAHSRADFWLIKKLAWATGNDPARTERIFDRSALATRGK